ncbi:UBX domain-containing protein 10 [Friedmanniomyces endolithicus]|uniref:UBX domain-containing protein 10 n=2 Tax=Dothideomycetidae TaxID=451867 RepID=A0A4V5N7U9_9PEZI|nr:UBX domain-containing protein 10 [Friedmanniomyces endolithicus]KAK5145462.1 UBX domain-containing protein 10 [Rachicladosporium monterosium]KAK0902698.1 UBX domain-containing protein 10 [Friedmanniomyces endolithicus]KAK0949811.1 UBX domain-containing protein 10 [Friedmanniomyces endolithicus]KAK0968678.1 UBX domain-containing protein 10 [Friedmanniomyces endolithicus]
MPDPDFDITSLSEEQQLALQQFTSVTDSELNAAVPLLQKCQWNAQIAITRFFDGDADTVDPAAEAARAPPPPPPQAGRRPETLIDSISPRSHSSRRPHDQRPDTIPRIVPTPDSQLLRPLPFPFSLLLLPFYLTYTLLQRLLGTITYLFPFLPRLLTRFRPSPPPRRRHLNPRDTTARFIRDFETEYALLPHSHTLPFAESGYAQAFDLAKRDLRFLLVVLFSPEHDDTAQFVRDTLLAPEIVAFLNDAAKSELVLWAGSVQDAEAYQVASGLGVTRFPYACLVVHSPAAEAGSGGGAGMTRVATFAGPVTAHDFLAKMSEAMAKQRPELEGLRRKRREQMEGRSILREQASAYERSLAQDREKARVKREELAQVEKAGREARERGERIEEVRRKREAWRRWRARGIPAEPGSEVRDAVRISLRLLDGQRVVRKFRAEAEVEEVYAFVECYDLVQQDPEDLSEKAAPEPEEGYEHKFGFRLVSPMPREVYDVKAGGRIGDRIGRSGNLVVEKVVVEDDDDDEEEE